MSDLSSNELEITTSLSSLNVRKSLFVSKIIITSSAVSFSLICRVISKITLVFPEPVPPVARMCVDKSSVDRHNSVRLLFILPRSLTCGFFLIGIIFFSNEFPNRISFATSILITYILCAACSPFPIL